MITLKKSQEIEIPDFVKMEEAGETAEFIFGWDEPRHLLEMQKSEVIYLSIFSDSNPVGFFILATEPDGETVEFRRIVVSKKGLGIGQEAIAAMEEYCRIELNAKLIWLDVMETNSRGRHIYEKLGYVFFKKDEQEGRPLLFYRKRL